jgi:hypothetical protein
MGTVLMPGQGVSLDYMDWQPIMSETHSGGYDSRRDAMKAFLIACAAIIVIAIGAFFALDHYQEPAEVAFSSPTGVRI